MCLIMEENERESHTINIPKEKRVRDSSLVLDMSDDNCRYVELTGGKGSSLAELMALSKQLTDEKNSVLQMVLSSQLMPITNFLKSTKV